MRYCKNCGARLEDNSRFCHNCGGIIEEVKETTEEIGKLHQEPITDYELVPKKIQGRKLGSILIIGFIIIASIGIITPIVYFSIRGSQTYTYMGDLYYTYHSETTEIIELNLDMFQGDIRIDYDISLFTLFSVTIEVYGQSLANISDTNSFTENTINNRTTISFIEDEFDFWDKTSLRHNLYITINPAIVVEYNLESLSGIIDISMIDTSNIDIKKLDIETFSGDIDVILGVYTKISTINAISLYSSSGRIDFYAPNNLLVDSPNFTIETLSGDMEIQIGSYAEIITSTFKLKTSSGSIDFYSPHFSNLDSTSFIAESFSGDIEIVFEDNTDINLDDFSITTSSGNVHFSFDHSSIFNVSDLIVTSFSSDIFIDFQDYVDIYLSDIALDSSSGSITINCIGVTFHNDIFWVIETLSGDIDLDLYPESIPLINHTATFDVDSSSGSVDISYLMSELNVGVEVTTDTTSGNIDLPNGQEYYKSASFDTKTIQYIFDIVTFSGDITVRND
ncbi:MAG: zinc-ribbon domain-containing protein [Candidatus Heimdallarchaeota archaeon]